MYLELQDIRQILNNLENVIYKHVKQRIYREPYFVHYDKKYLDKVLNNMSRHDICNMIKCSPGYQPIYGTYYESRTNTEHLDWRCVKCSTNTVKSTYNSDRCKRCPELTKSNEKRTICYDPYIKVFVEMKSVVLVAALVIILLSVMINIFVLSVFVRYRRTPVVRASGYDFSVLQLCIHLLLFVTLPILVLIEPTQTRCILQPTFIGVLLAMISTITVVKTFKALHAFKSSLVISKRSAQKTKITEWFVFTIVTIDQICIAAVTFTQNLPTVDEILDKKLEIRHLYCNNLSHIHTQLVYVLVLSIICLVQAFRGRNLPVRFNESKRTTYSMLITALILGITFPISMNQVDKKNQNLVILISVSIINALQLVVMYSYKLYIVLFQPKKNTKQAFQLSMMRNAEKNVAMKLKARIGKEVKNEA